MSKYIGPSNCTEMASIIKTDINIYYVRNGRRYALPYALNDFNPKFSWDLPAGVTQKSFVFEMRTQYPVLYSDGVTYRCAYHNSSNISSEHSADIVSIKPEYLIINTLDQNTWQGSCEVRLTVYGTDGKIYCTHESTNETYDFEGDKPQYKKWGSKRDELYFVYDNTINTILNSLQGTIQFSKATDLDTEQELTYDFQISRSPLFDEGFAGQALSWSGLPMSQLQQFYEMPVAFQNEKNPEKWEEETASSLYPNTMYFMRARAFDGLDYGDWSTVNAFTCVINFVPICHIVGIEYPVMTDTNGVPIKDNEGNVQYDRPNGEIKIKCYVTDSDNDYVSVGFGYSMQVTASESIKLGVPPSESATLGISNYDNANLIRASIKENLIYFPVSKVGSETPSDKSDDYPGDENVVELTWITSSDIQDVVKTGVCLYMFCFDGVSDGYPDALEGIEINNLGIGSEIGNASIQAQQMWLRGKMRMDLAYPVLPKDMLEQVLVNGLPPAEDAEESIRGWKNDQNGNECWYDLWVKAEKGKVPGIAASYGLRRITFDEDWQIEQWDKYPSRTYESGVYDEPGPNRVELVGRDEEGNIVHIYVNSSDTWESNATIERKQVELPDGSVVSFDEMTAYDGGHIIKVIYKDEEHTQELEKGFVSFCPECKTLYPLTTFRDGNELKFQCPHCKGVYPMQTRYHDAIAHGVLIKFLTNVYAYYNGYNSSTGTDVVTKQLHLLMQSEYDRMKQEWEEQSNSDSFPYDFAQILKWYKEKDEQGEKPSDDQIIVKDNERFGFMPADKLLNMSPRPEIDAFLRVRPQKALGKHYVVYLDGMQLNACVEGDYAKDFEPQEDDTEAVAEDKKAVKKLTKQRPWSLFSKIAYMYAEGKSVIPPDKGYYESGGSNSNEDNEQEQQGGSGEEQLTEPEINVVFDGEVETIGTTTVSTSDGPLTYIYNRMSGAGGTDFAVTFVKGVNDRYRYFVNGNELVEGSILSDDVEVLTLTYPENLSGDENFVAWKSVLQKLFPSKLFDFEIVSAGNNHISYSIKGVMNEQLKSYQLLDCPENCYSEFGVQPFFTSQSWQRFTGQINSGETPYINYGVLPPKEDDDDYNFGEQEVDEHRYYYTNTTRAKHKIHAEESPIDNRIEESYNCAGGESVGEPMFTCYRDEVDRNGYHFKYSESDYAKTHKIYVRKYHLETCNPFPNPKYGYRNWDVFEIEGKPGRYCKKQVVQSRGSVPEQRMIDVISSNGKIVKEIGWFEPGVEDLPGGKVRGNCFSHNKLEISDSSESTPEEDIPFVRKGDYTWRNKLIPQQCVVFEYVDIEEALRKNPTDGDNGISPLSHKNPFGISLSYRQLYKRYGKYVMGPYELSEDQQKLGAETRTVWATDSEGNNYLKLEENTYEKKFVETMRVMDENNQVVEREVEFYETMPNNFKESIPGAVFVTEPSQGKTITTHIIPKKKNASDTASVHTYNDRYKKVWADNNWPPYDEQNDGTLSQITVEPWNPSVFARVGIYEKWGYEPMHKVGKYWSVDEDGLYAGKYIPLENTTVHGIYQNPFYSQPGEPFGDYRVLNRYIAERTIISDRSFRKTDDSFDRMEWLDYRVVNRCNFEEKNYFSGYPGGEHEWFAGRPEPPYPYDRQWRVVNRYDDGIKYGRWGFIYLQDQWNNYNRVHWVASQDENTYAIIKVEDITENPGEEEFVREFSLKTVTAVWDDIFNAWCIPYKENEQTDMIDTSENNFLEGHSYRFVLTLGNKNTHAISGDNAYSIRFSISREYVSPATIVATSYDPWTGIISVTFRFDDAMGRRYDVNAVQYALGDPDLQAGDNQDGNAGHWQNIDMGNITGNVQDLASNDGSEIGSLVARHTIKFPVSSLSLENATDSLRIRLISDVSVNRKGLTLPVFQIKMWANEFLKIAEDNIALLQGYKSQWQWVNEVNDDGEVEGKWKYLENGESITILGKISEVQNKINILEEEFNKFYLQLAKFEGLDLNAYEFFLKSVGAWDDFYYGTTVFEAFVDELGARSDWEKYSSQASEQLETVVVKQRWLEKTAYKWTLESWFEGNYIELLESYYKSHNSHDAFVQWFGNVHPAILAQQSRAEYCKLCESDYVKYWASQGVDVSQSNSGSGSDSAESVVYTDELCFGYVSSSADILSAWMSYYAGQNSYADTQYESRKFIVLEHQSEFDEYVSQHDFSWFDSNSEAIAMQYFVKEMQLEGQVQNFGKTSAKLQFMQQADNSGIMYSMKYQSYNDELQLCYQQLQENIDVKQELETDFRISLIRQGFFCNGFENNRVFKESDNQVNTCFRWRVETRPYEGAIVNNTEYDEDGNPIYSEDDDTVNGYQDRYNMYFRTQLDFFDTFNSQADGKPLRDIVFVYDGKTDECRLLAGIKDADSVAATMPGSAPAQEENNVTVNTESTSLQFFATFAIPRNELPGQLVGDTIPESHQRPSGDNGFESIYYWRVASYNLVSCPILGNIMGDSAIRKIASYNNNEVSLYECLLSSRSYHQDIVNGATNWMLYAAEERLPQPEWRKDVDSPGFNENMKHYNNAWVNQDVLDSGQVQFVTDRPRQYKPEESNSFSGSGSRQREIEFVDDNIGNYETLWYPTGVEREKPCIVRHNLEYLLFSHKSNGTAFKDGRAFVQYQITMSRGFVSNVMGEECQCFPRYCNQSASTIKFGSGEDGNALGFLNAHVVSLGNNLWRMYFNAQKYNESTHEFYTEIWKCDTIDFDKWGAFERVSVLRNGAEALNLLQPFVSIGSNQVELFCSSNNHSEKSVIERYVSSDGIHFEYAETINGVYVDMYDAQSPCLARISEHVERLYLTCVFSESESEKHSIILSRDRVDGQWVEDQNAPSDYKIEFGGDNYRYFVSALNQPIQVGNSTVTVNNFANAIYSNAFVCWDTDCFTPVLRVYFNQLDHPFVYNDSHELEQDNSIVETSIHTRYLEEYEWEAIYPFGNLRNNDDFDKYVPGGYQDNVWMRDNETFTELKSKVPYEFVADNGERVLVCPMSISTNGVDWKLHYASYYYNYTTPFPTSFKGEYVRIQFVSWSENIFAIKAVGVTPMNNSLRCMAQSKWIDWANINYTQATLMPEPQEDYEYSLENYSYEAYIVENGLQEQYEKWLEESSNSSSSTEELQLNFLIDSKRYSDYLWWSRKGPGIYRYLPVVQQYSWDGDVKKEAPSAND